MVQYEGFNVLEEIWFLLGYGFKIIQKGFSIPISINIKGFETKFMIWPEESGSGSNKEKLS